jgi:signal transduction histidine kinase
MRLAVLAVVLTATTVIVALIPRADLFYGPSVQQVVLETTASLFSLLAAFLIIIRVRRNSCRSELVLATALAVIALSNVLFVMLPELIGPATANAAQWAAVIGRLSGSMLFALAAFVPPGALLRPRRAEAVAAVSAFGVVLLAAAIPHALGSDVPQAVTPPGVPGVSFGLHVAPALAVAQTVAAVLAITAAAHYLRRSQELGDEFSGWLAAAAVFAAAAHANYSLFPSVYPPMVSLGDIFSFCCYAVLLLASMREIRSHWHTLVTATLAEERQRIACDLHDGLSQELAYLTRNLSGLQGSADEKTLRQLRYSVDRARLASRRAVSRVVAPAHPEIADALTEAACEVAERFDLDLELDLAPGIGMAPERTDALVGIAREALTNAARHSGSRQVSLSLCRAGGRVLMRVRDSGRGFDPASPRGGFGVTSMRHRARSVGGDVRISSRPGVGSEVEAAL